MLQHLVRDCVCAGNFLIQLTIRITVGYVHEKCHHDVPSGSQLKRVPGGRGMDVFDASGAFLRRLPACRAESTFYKPKPVDAALKSQTNNNVTNKNVGAYDGWLAYTTYEHRAGVDKFLGSFSVPENVTICVYVQNNLII
jgi:hypothetical protein